MENVEKQEQSPEQQQQENKNKVAKAFEANIERIEAVLDRKLEKKPRKRIKGDLMSSIVESLFKEDDEKNQEEFKKELRELVEKHTTLWTEIGKKEKELEEVKMNQMKAFNEASKKLLDKVDGLPELMTKRIEALKAVAKGASEGSEEKK